MAKAKFMNGEFSQSLKEREDSLQSRWKQLRISGKMRLADQYLSGNPGETFWKKEY